MSYLSPNRPQPSSSTYTPANQQYPTTTTNSTYIPSATNSTYINTPLTGLGRVTSSIGTYAASPRSSTYIQQPASTQPSYSYQSTQQGGGRVISNLATYTSNNQATGYRPATTSSYTSTYLPSNPQPSGTTRVMGSLSNYVQSQPTSSTYVPSSTNGRQSVTVSGNEYALQKKVEQMQRETDQLKNDKDRLQLVVHDLKKYAPEYKGDMPEDPDLDGSYMNLKQRNVIETMEMNIKQLKKKNRMLMEENDMLKTQVRTLCAADDTLGDKFMQSEVAKLQTKVRELKSKNSEMEIQLKTYESDKRLGNRNKGEVLNFDEGMREDYERMKRELTVAYARINQAEKGEMALGKANIDRYKALTNRVTELENQNQQLLNRIKENGGADIMRRSGQADGEKEREAMLLRRENEELREELMQKNEVIRKLQSGKGNMDNPEAVQNLITANERLLAEVMKYQEKMNQSQSNMSIQKSHAFGESKKSPVLRSEFIDQYKDSRYTLD